jgi:hypothetical protein
MREIRKSGSEGGGTGTTGPPYPYFAAEFATSPTSRSPIGYAPSRAVLQRGT